MKKSCLGGRSLCRGEEELLFYLKPSRPRQPRGADPESKEGITRAASTEGSFSGIRGKTPAHGVLKEIKQDVEKTKKPRGAWGAPDTRRVLEIGWGLDDIIMTYSGEPW